MRPHVATLLHQGHDTLEQVVDIETDDNWLYVSSSTSRTTIPTTRDCVHDSFPNDKSPSVRYRSTSMNRVYLYRGRDWSLTNRRLSISFLCFRPYRVRFTKIIRHIHCTVANLLGNSQTHDCRCSFQILLPTKTYKTKLAIYTSRKP